MTTYRSGHEPESSPASWYDISGTNRVFVCVPNMRIEVEDIEADRICRAFHVEALALDYAQARYAMDNAQTAADIEAMRSVYADAARALCEAVR